MARHKSAIIFIATSALYFLSRSPRLDEIDSVNFAMGVREFNVWEHQPHPPGYPLYIFFGWLGTKFFGTSPQLSLHFVSALGGALFVAAWFGISRRQFDERLAWWVTICLAIMPVVWMTATKVLTDAPAAGLISVEILATTVCFEVAFHTETGIAGRTSSRCRAGNFRMTLRTSMKVGT